MVERSFGRGLCVLTGKAASMYPALNIEIIVRRCTPVRIDPMTIQPLEV